MKRFHSNVSSAKAALQQRPEVLNALSMYLSIHVLLKMVHKSMVVFRFEIVVSSKLISHNRRASLNKITHGSMHGGILAISDYPCFDFSTALKCADNYSLAVSALHSNAIAQTAAFTLVHIACLAANISLINLHRPVRSTKFAASLVLQSKADAMQHEPCRFLSYADGAGDLVGTDTISAIGDHPDHNQPFLQRNRGILKDGSNLCRELAFCVGALALPLALVVKEYNVIPTTGRADYYTIWPAQQSHVGQSVVRIGVENYRILQGLWLLLFAVHARKITKCPLICQVYYCRTKVPKGPTQACPSYNYRTILPVEKPPTAPKNIEPTSKRDRKYRRPLAQCLRHGVALVLINSCRPSAESLSRPDIS